MRLGPSSRVTRVWMPAIFRRYSAWLVLLARRSLLPESRSGRAVHPAAAALVSAHPRGSTFGLLDTTVQSGGDLAAAAITRSLWTVTWRLDTDHHFPQPIGNRTRRVSWSIRGRYRSSVCPGALAGCER